MRLDRRLRVAGTLAIGGILGGAIAALTVSDAAGPPVTYPCDFDQQIVVGTDQVYDPAGTVGDCPTTTTAPDTTVDSSSPEITEPSTSTSVEPSTTSSEVDTTAVTSTTQPATTTSTAAPTTSSTVPATTTTIAATTTTVAPTPGVLYRNDFTSPADMQRLVFDLHIPSTGPLEPAYHGDHNMSCGAPDTTFRIIDENGGMDGIPAGNGNLNDVVYYCQPGNDPTKAHFMTAVKSAGYDIISFAPINPATGTVVFPASANKICWDQNLTDLGRKWVNVTVISKAKYDANHDLSFISLDFEPNRGEPGDPNNPPARLLSGDDFMYSGFGAGVSFMVGRTETFFDNYANKYFNNDVVNRYRTCLRDNGNGTITRTQVRPGGTNTVTGQGRFPAGEKVFIINDDTYDTFKDDVPDTHVAWHWDAIEVSHS